MASYTVLAEDLASHGYAVVGINPTESTDVVFPDGHQVPATALGSVMEPNIDDWYVSAARVTNVWVADAQFVVKTLSATAPAIGSLDFNRVAYVGHSVGGAAALEACRIDSRCSGAVDLGGTLWTDVRTTGLQAPSLIIQSGATAECDDFCQRANADFSNVIAAGNSQQLRVAGSRHANFQNGALMWGPLNGPVLGSIDPVRMADITRDIVRAFLDVHILDEPTATLSTVIAEITQNCGDAKSKGVRAGSPAACHASTEGGHAATERGRLFYLAGGRLLDVEILPHAWAELRLFIVA